MSGWFAMKHGTLEHEMFAPVGRWSRFEAWAWLIDNAAYSPSRIDIGGTPHTVPRGSLCYSLRFLAKKWRWSTKAVSNFLRDLEAHGTVKTSVVKAGHKKETRRTQITLCNYDKYQSAGNAEETHRKRTGNEEEQVKQNIPVGAGADAPPNDPAKVMWDSGVSLLVGAGMKDKQARSLIGKWNRDHGQESVIAAIGAAVREGPAVPVEFIEKCFQWRAKKAEPEIGEVRTFGGRKRIYNGKQDGWITIHEDDDADSMGNPAGSGDRNEQDERDDADDVPRMQSAQAEQEGSLSECDLQGGRGGVELLALRAVGGALL